MFHCSLCTSCPHLHRRIQDVRESCDLEADALRNKLRTAVSEYESQIDKLRYQVAEYRTNAEAQSKMAEREWSSSWFSDSHV